MNITLLSNLLDLRRGQLLRIQDATGTRLVCTRGALWITQDNDPSDHFIATGDSLLLDRPGLAVVSASHDSCLRIEAPRSATGPLDSLLELTRRSVPNLAAGRGHIAIP